MPQLYTPHHLFPVSTPDGSNSTQPTVVWYDSKYGAFYITQRHSSSHDYPNPIPKHPPIDVSLSDADTLEYTTPSRVPANTVVPTAAVNTNSSDTLSVWPYEFESVLNDMTQQTRQQSVNPNTAIPEKANRPWNYYYRLSGPDHILKDGIPICSRSTTAPPPSDPRVVPLSELTPAHVHRAAGTCGGICQLCRRRLARLQILNVPEFGGTPPALDERSREAGFLSPDQYLEVADPRPLPTVDDIEATTLPAPREYRRSGRQPVFPDTRTPPEAQPPVSQPLIHTDFYDESLPIATVTVDASDLTVRVDNTISPSIESPEVAPQPPEVYDPKTHELTHYESPLSDPPFVYPNPVGRLTDISINRHNGTLTFADGATETVPRDEIRWWRQYMYGIVHTTDSPGTNTDE